MENDERRETREEESENKNENAPEDSQDNSSEEIQNNNENNNDTDSSLDSDYIMKSIGELAAQVKALRLAVDGFADMGGVIRESTDPDTNVSGTPSDFANNEDSIIDDDVIRDIDNIVFND